MDISTVVNVANVSSVGFLSIGALRCFQKNVNLDTCARCNLQMGLVSSLAYGTCLLVKHFR
uniref:Uncharacterized protein n=1 Tax=Megaviridae environmental sample TaxID=1737588 RepID=A0A5J6VK87_9VIRU|nr:MAG: hypothetical protein [Megaviridae environmental sample]